jgi:hypothetical protein
MPMRKLIDIEKIVELASKWFLFPLLVVMFIMLLALSMDSVQKWIQNHGLAMLGVPEIVGMALVVTIFVMVIFQQQLKQVGEHLSSFSPSGSSKIVHGGVQEVYNELHKILDEIGPGSGREKGLEVMGLTLYTAWPMLLEPILSSAEGALRGWRVNIFFLSSDYIKANPCFSESWDSHSSAELKAIQEFAKKMKHLLKQRGTELNVSQYKFFPAVHGFRTDAGHLLISYIHWNGELLDSPTQFYEVFQPSDKSARASRYHALFENWIQRAKREAATGKVI